MGGGKKKSDRVRRRERKNIAAGQAHIKSSFNNTIISITDPTGALVSWSSGGTVGFRARASRLRSRRSRSGSRRSQPWSMNASRRSDRQGSGLGRETASAHFRLPASRSQHHGQHTGSAQRMPARSVEELAIG